MASATAAKGGGRGALGSVLFYVFLFLFVLVSLFPLIWIFKMSIITKSELFASPPTILPANPTGAEYSQIFGDPAFQKALLNSTIIAGVTTIICLFFGAIAGYAIARLRFRFKSPVMTLILAISFFPSV
ncbi:MAG: carbohydrate ABC transporter permease, partial [Actinomycetota bacterium]|nr:carbohydrate ABC transporter permease [Actinomycetota bacterium]